MGVSRGTPADFPVAFYRAGFNAPQSSAIQRAWDSIREVPVSLPWRYSLSTVLTNSLSLMKRVSP
jgi:hypothetical protein